MTDTERLSDLLFPDVDKAASYYEDKYKKRDLPEGAKVTRFAPSPTGFVHFGSMFPVMVSERLAHQSGGVFYLRIEDTDSKRFVEGAEEDLVKTYKYFNVNFDESFMAPGEYGPYRQSERRAIYRTFAKKMVSEGKAYPCFCSEEALNETRKIQEENKENIGYYGKYAKCRDLSLEQIKEKLSAGMPWVLRFKSFGDCANKVKFTDLIKGTIEITENDFDHVMLKSDGMPTYHFAHAVDDHLMGTTHVVRGEEWLPSLPYHIQLFAALGFKLPKYLHISQLMKNVTVKETVEENGVVSEVEKTVKKKLSKRDAGAGMNYYVDEGYAPECIAEYVMTLLNSNFEEWRRANIDADINDFPFSIKKMSQSGSLFDLAKLNDISKNIVCRMSAERVYNDVLAWAKDHDAPFYKVLADRPEYAKAILSIGRSGNKPRKDFAVWSEVKAYVSFFYNEFFTISDAIPDKFSKDDIKKVLSAFANSFDINADKTAWFDNIKNIASSIGYAADMKEYKASPEKFAGNVGDVSMFIRIAVTGRQNSPDLYDVMQLLGYDEVINRVKKYLASLDGDKKAETNEEEENSNFLYEIIDADLASGRETSVHTRFPPEPNGYLHIGSAKAIYINYSASKRYNGLFNLRYDDTNPSKEDDEYVQSIYEDLKWLGAEPTGGVFYGSDYFDKCYEFAVKLIKEGKAYVCDLNADEMREYRGTLTEPGKNSPYRDRSVEENLSLFERMKNGEFPDGYCTLRAKIDMTSSNMNMRDPAIYRILHTSHHRQKDKWCIYPLYDFAHPIQDALEGISHSMCSIEFENHRPLYDWVVDNVGFEKKPHQYEFARLNVTNTVMSKRYLRKLVEDGVVDGWDDPRMPTLCGLRRRGYTPSSIFEFVKRAGVAKNFSIVDIALLEHCIRDELNLKALRRIAVLEPIKVVIENYPSDKTEYFSVSNNPNDENAASREVAFTKEIYIDKSDFSLDPPPKYFRLKPGGEVRLMGAYIIKYKDVVYDSDGNVKEVICTADLESGNGNPVDGRKIKGTIHWISAENCIDINVAKYDKLFNIENTSAIPEGETFDDYLNKESVTLIKGCKAEKALENAELGDRFQFVRTGYFCKDSKHENTFNMIVELKDSKPKQK